MFLDYSIDILIIAWSERITALSSLPFRRMPHSPHVMSSTVATG